MADFGISVISQSGRTSLENPQQGRAGTPWYMAPEQIKGKPSRSSDQYALAIIIYEWLTGEPPFPGGVLEVYGQHLYATPDPLPKTIPMRSDELESVLMKALAKDPKDRYPTIQDFANALEAAYNKEIQRHQSPKPTAIDGKTGDQWLNEGYAHRDAKRYAEAIVAYSKAIELNPVLTSVYNGRGFAYAELKQYQRAICDYNVATELDPAYSIAYNNRGYAYKNLKQYQEAIRDYSKALELNPVNATIYCNRGTAYLGCEQYQEAIRDYSKAIELKPAYTSAYHGRGVAWYYLDQHREAMRDYNKAIELDPNSASAYSNRGSAYRALKNYEQAIADYDRALTLDPNFTIARENREQALQGLNEQRRSRG